MVTAVLQRSRVPTAASLGEWFFASPSPERAGGGRCRGCAVALEHVGGPVAWLGRDVAVAARGGPLVVRDLGLPASRREADAPLRYAGSDVEGRAAVVLAASSDGERLAVGFDRSPTLALFARDAGGVFRVVPLSVSLPEACSALAFAENNLLYSAHAGRLAAWVADRGVLQRSVAGPAPLVGLAAHGRDAIALAANGAAAAWTLAADKNLSEAPLDGLGRAVAVASWRGRFVVGLGAAGELAFFDVAAKAAVVRDANMRGATLLACGADALLVAGPRRLDAWAVDDRDGTVEIAPLARLDLDSAPLSLCPSADATLGLVATADGTLLYFNTAVAHDDEFLAADEAAF